MESAEAQARQELRIFGESVGRELDAETELSIEVNGVAAARVTCLDSALAELAAGWAFMHRYCRDPRDFDRSTVQQQRASLMVRGGIDIDGHRSALIGERSEHAPVPDPWPTDEEFTVPSDVLLDILRESWQLFRHDRMAEGSIHAALASAKGIEVVAFDITAEHAVAKVLGWSLCSSIVPTHAILIVNGMITRSMVDAAARLGVRIIATPNVPTANAYRTARVVGISIVGYMRQATAGLFADAGVVAFEDDSNSDT